MRQIGFIALTNVTHSLFLVPPPRIELGRLGFQASMQTTTSERQRFVLGVLVFEVLDLRESLLSLCACVRLSTLGFASKIFTSLRSNTIVGVYVLEDVAFEV